MVVCTLCNRSFKSRNSLRSHKSRFHKHSEGSTGKDEEKPVERQTDGISNRFQINTEKQHPAFGYDVYKYAKEEEHTGKRFHSDDEMST